VPPTPSLKSSRRADRYRSRAKASHSWPGTGSARIHRDHPQPRLQDVGFRGLFLLAIVPWRCCRSSVAGHRTGPIALAEVASDHVVRSWCGGPAFRSADPALDPGLRPLVHHGPANSFIFLFARTSIISPESRRRSWSWCRSDRSRGLLIGRWMADHYGRRVTGALGMTGLALFGVLSYAGLAMTSLLVTCSASCSDRFSLRRSARSSMSSFQPQCARRRPVFLAAGVLGAVVGLVVFAPSRYWQPLLAART